MYINIASAVRVHPRTLNTRPEKMSLQKGKEA